MKLPACLNPRRIIVKSEYDFIGSSKGPSFLGIEDTDTTHILSSYARLCSESQRFHSYYSVSTSAKIQKDFKDLPFDEDTSYYYADELYTVFKHATEWEWYDRIVLTDIETKKEYKGLAAISFVLGLGK